MTHIPKESWQYVGKHRKERNLKNLGIIHSSLVRARVGMAYPVPT